MKVTWARTVRKVLKLEVGLNNRECRTQNGMESGCTEHRRHHSSRRSEKAAHSERQWNMSPCEASQKGHEDGRASAEQRDLQEKDHGPNGPNPQNESGGNQYTTSSGPQLTVEELGST